MSYIKASSECIDDLHKLMLELNEKHPLTLIAVIRSILRNFKTMYPNNDVTDKLLNKISEIAILKKGR